jgi:hypothetical protein
MGMKALNKVFLLFCIFSLALSCRNEEADSRPRIEKITFEEETKRTYEGDTAKITVFAEPREAKAYDKIEYWVSRNDIIEVLPQSDNDGVVFKGLKAGNAVIQASVNGMSVFCNVTVIGAGGNIIPYIVVSDYVIESEKGERYNIVASLVGGTPADESGFTFSYTGQDKNIINLVQNNNIGVIDTVNTGQSVVTVSHPKAQFSVNTLVFVKEKGEIPVYITTDDNVINLNVNDSIREYAVNLWGKNNNDYHLFRHEILDGNNVISLTSGNNIGTIMPKSKGIALIKVSHQNASHPIEIVVIVNEEIEYKYIDVDSTLIVMNEGDFRVINADIVGDVPQDYVNKYVFENEDDSIIEVSNSYYQASIRALKKGRSVIKVKNQYVDFDREVLVIVNGQESLIDQEKYITTNQNVITTEVNGEVQLTMTLVGGNSADANNFIWTVDDGSIIEVTNQHGSVRYNSRAAVSNTNEKFEATALIRAKKIGTTTITLENPKARNSFSVVVKVYKQGVFGVIPVVIDGPGIYRIEEGQNIDVYLRVVTGLEKSLTNIRWESGNPNIVSVAGNANLSGILKGVGEGITTLTVTGDNVKNDYTATVIVGGREYLQGKPYVYVNKPYISVIKGESVYFRVECVNLAEKDMSGLSVVNNSGDIIETFAYRNSITVKGLSLGEGEIIIGGDGLNTLKVTVMVEDYALNPEMPYYLRPEKYIYGMVKGRGIEIPVDLVGGIASNEKDIKWKIEDSTVADIKANGKKCLVTGKKEGQTVLTVDHYKSHNDVQIVIYVVLSDAELKSKVIIHVPEQNILLKQGESRFISIITNAVEGQNDFRWGTSNANVTAVRPSGDRKKAYIDAVSTGNAQVTVGYGNQIPAVIYVSVINSSYDLAYINVPSIVEMAAGQTITINAAASNIYNKYEINWVSKDESIAMAYGNGDSCTITAFKGGKTVLEVRYPGFARDIILFVYNNSGEMASAYIFAGEQSRYAINKGDIVNIGLAFGIKGYPEHDLVNIRWGTEDRSKIEVNGSGKSASVRGLAAGIGVVSVQDNYGNDVKIEIVVQDAGKAGKYHFSIDSKNRIKGILAGNFADIEVKVFNGTAEIYNISGIEYTVENSNIIRVEKNDGGIRVYAPAGKEGQSYITLTHDLVEDAKILIYTSLTEGGLLNAYPIMAEKSNYLVEKGGNFTVSVQTINEDSSKLRNISYDLEKKNGVVNIQERSKKEIMVSAESEGSEVILVRYNAEIVQRIYVSVVEKGYGLNAGYMITENIIGLLKGQQYETRADTDTDWGIIWKSEKDYICDFVEVEGKRAVLRANWQGETLITVRKGDIERHIFVFVVETQEELDAYHAVNIEQRKYKIRKGDSVSVNIHSYQGKVEGRTHYEDYYGNSAPYGNVITVSSTENNKLSVKGVNEGTAAIKVANEFYRSGIIVYVEVYPAGEDGSIGVNNKEHYITAEKTLYVIGPEEKDVYIQVGVLPDNFYGDAYWEWTVLDEDIIKVDSLGRSAVVNPLGEGQTKITVSNKECANSLEITVIAGERFVSGGGNAPYIYVEKDLFEVVKGSGVFGIPYSIINVTNIVLKNITYELIGDGISVSHDVNSGVFNVQAVKTGVARFDIKYGSLRREVYVLVKENLNAGNIYLTTSENYVISSIGELRNINIELKGYDEIDSGKFRWRVSDNSPKNVVQLVGNGLVGQIYGVSEGSVVITVEHIRNDEYKAAYPLTINVKIVKDKSKEKVVYLTTQRNVIETVEGSQSEMIYVQKVGGDVTKTQTTWISSDESIVSLTENKGYSARLNAHKAGSAKITVNNIEADYQLQIVVVVRESMNNNIYISSASNLVWLSPGEKNYRIGVDLVNGEAKDYNRFVWRVQDQIPADSGVLNGGGKVIGIVASNEQCLIDALNIGVAHIRIECPGRAEMPLIITVYVSHYREIKFSASQKNIVMNEVDIVELNLPTYERMKDKARVWAEDINGGITNTVDVYYTNSLVMLHARKVGHAVIKAAVEGKEGYAEMTVSVLERHDPNVNRVVVGKNIHVLSARSSPIVLNASVTGPDIYDADLDEIKWEITRNYAENDSANKNPLVDIIPKNISAAAAKSRTIQLTAQNEGNAVLKISHPKVTEEYWKDIYIVIAEMGNHFTIDKKEVTVNMLRPETVAVNIVGGTTRDYEEVKWVAKMQQKWDGTLLEVVRVMGSGREVTLYPINNGETEVYAFYNGDFVSVKVSVVSDYYFEFRNSNEYMYPGEVRNLPFEVKPASSNVNWIYNPGPDVEPVISFTEIQGSQPGGSGTVNRFLQVTAKAEGTASIVGMANGKIATVNIMVAYDYDFTLDRNIPGIVTAVNFDNTAPKYEIKNSSGVVTESSTGVVELAYMIHPANTYIRCLTNNISGLTVDISDPVPTIDSRNRSVGIGTIKFTGLREMVENVVFQQYKARASGGEEVMVNGTETRPSRRTVRIMYYFKNVEIKPFFVRGEGKYSNSGVGSGIPSTGGQYRLMKDGTVVSGAETITGSGSTYSLTLGDGEVHYILFDKKYNNASVDIKTISVNGSPPSRDNEEITIHKDDSLGVEYKASIVNFTLDDVTYKALRLSGGKDYIKYSRAAFDKELFISVQSPYAVTGAEEIINEVALYSDYYLIEDAYISTEFIYNGDWYDIVSKKYNSKGQANQSYEYFLIKKSYLSSCNEAARLQIMQWARSHYITSKPELVNYWGDPDYTYYLTGNEFMANHGAPAQIEYIWSQLLSNGTEKVTVYKPEYYYTWEVYNNFAGFFDGNYYDDTNYSHLQYTGDQVTGGYIISYGVLGAGLIEESAAESIVVYEYDREKMEEFQEGNDVEYDVNNWNTGLFTSSMGNKIVGYDPVNNLYSTNVYMAKISSVQTNENNVVTTTYNVLRDYYVNDYLYNIKVADHHNVEGAYMHFINNNTVSNTYLKNYYRALMGSLIADKGWYEYIYYDGLIQSPIWYKGIRRRLWSNGNYPISIPVIGSNFYSYYSYQEIFVGYVQVKKPYKAGYVYETVKEYKKIYYYHTPKMNIFGGKYGDYSQKLYVGSMYSKGNVFFSDVYVQNMAVWHDHNTLITAPAYIFNRFPMRYEGMYTGYVAQIIGINNGGGKPMPSISRSILSSGKKDLTVTYSKFDPANSNNGKNDDMTLSVNCVIRGSHSQYMGGDSSDGTIIYYRKDNSGKYINELNSAEIKELEGGITSFDDLKTADKDNEVLKYTSAYL